MEYKKENIKRFDDVFRMLFLVITIMISVGANSFGIIHLSGAAVFILVSLACWIIGHLVGSHKNGDESEGALKLLAWSFAVLVAPAVILKSLFGMITLSFEWNLICFIISLSATLPMLWWLDNVLSVFQRRTFGRNIAFFFLGVAGYLAYTGITIL